MTPSQKKAVTSFRDGLTAYRGTPHTFEYKEVGECRRVLINFSWKRGGKLHRVYVGTHGKFTAFNRDGREFNDPLMIITTSE